MSTARFSPIDQIRALDDCVLGDYNFVDKDVVANLNSGYDVRMGGIASYLLGDQVYDETLCKVGQFL